MRPRVLLVDSTYLMKQSFNGAKNVYAKGQGKDANYSHIGGLYTFMTIIRKMIRELNINKVVLSWDGENSGKMRYRLYKEYKGNRSSKSWFNKIVLTEAEIRREEESKKSFLKQKVRAQQYAEELFMRQIEVDEIESDDIIAYYVSRYHKTEDIFIYTNDRDFMELVSFTNVQLYLANKKMLINKGNFKKLFGYELDNFLLMKTICGDASDNITGIDGVKETTLLKYFPKLKEKVYRTGDLLREAKRIQERRVKDKKKPIKALTNLIEGRPTIERNKKLMDLKNPFIDQEGMSEVNFWATCVLDDEDRGSKNLMNLMKEDGFLSNYHADFVSYVQPFYSVILREKKLLKENKLIVEEKSK